jgi:hypothetical protein
MQESEEVKVEALRLPGVEQQAPSLLHRRADDLRPSASEQQASSLSGNTTGAGLHPVDAGRFGRRADDYALGEVGRGCRPSAGEQHEWSKGPLAIALIESVHHSLLPLSALTSAPAVGRRPIAMACRSNVLKSM